MSQLEQERRELAEAVHIEVHGIEPIAPEARDSTPLQQLWVWMGANLAPINWVLGTLGVIFGLSVVETILVIVAGNIAGGVLFGLFSTMGHRTGVNQMVLSRSTFGRRGAYIPSFVLLLMAMGWIGVNTWIVLDLALGIAKALGVEGGMITRYAVALGIMVVQVAIAIWGFYAIRTFEKYTVPLTAAIMVIMTILTFTRIDIVWTTSKVTGAAKFTAMTQLMTAIGIGWPISWLTMTSDYSRFVNPKYTNKQVFWGSALGMFIPTVWLASLGAAIASSGQGADPAALVAQVFGAMTIPVLFVVMHGPVATNILNIYSCSLALLSLDIRVKRWKVSALAGAVGTAVLLAFLQANDFAAAFDKWMVSILVWTSSWAGITAVEYFILRRTKVDVKALYAPPEQSIYGDFNVPALASLAAGILAAWSFEYGLVDIMRGPLATRLGNIDLSWLAGMLVGGGLYYVLAGARVRRAQQDRPPMQS
ncbi:MAG: cytosine permease [Polyangiaceae bacterium]|nr:cytosine permease [Polyangiaceae bacterium]